MPSRTSLELLCGYLSVSGGSGGRVGGLTASERAVFVVILTLMFSPMMVNVHCYLFGLRGFGGVGVLVRDVKFILFTLCLETLGSVVTCVLVFLVFVDCLDCHCCLLDLRENGSRGR